MTEQADTAFDKEDKALRMSGRTEVAGCLARRKTSKPSTAWSSTVSRDSTLIPCEQESGGSSRQSVKGG